MEEILMDKDTVSDSYPEMEPLEQEQRNCHSPHSSLSLLQCINATKPTPISRRRRRARSMGRIKLCMPERGMMCSSPRRQVAKGEGGEGGE